MKATASQLRRETIEIFKIAGDQISGLHDRGYKTDELRIAETQNPSTADEMCLMAARHLGPGALTLSEIGIFSTEAT